MTRMTRADWLRFEIALYEDELTGLPEDAPRRETVKNVIREHVAELGILEQDAGRLNIRLTGRSIHGNDAPADVVLAITRAMSELADEFATNLYIAPARQGSHILEFVAPPESQPRLQLTDDEPSIQTFADSVGVLMGLANRGAPADTATELLEEEIGDLSLETLGIAKRLFGALADQDVTLHIDATSRDLSGQRLVDRQWANFVKSILADTTKTTDTLTMEGRLEGLMRAALRFELVVNDKVIRGRVPAAMRDDLDGIRIPSDVVAVMDRITTLLASGATRSFYRLKQIKPRDDSS